MDNHKKYKKYKKKKYESNFIQYFFFKYLPEGGSTNVTFVRFLPSVDKGVNSSGVWSSESGSADIANVRPASIIPIGTAVLN